MAAGFERIDGRRGGYNCQVRSESIIYSLPTELAQTDAWGDKRREDAEQRADEGAAATRSGSNKFLLNSAHSAII